MTEAALERHRLYEDALALVTGTLFVALGVALFAEAKLLPGSTAGLALLLTYLTGLPFGLAFSLINLPFYLLALRRLGWRFTLRTFVAVSLVSLFARLTPGWIGFSHLAPLYAAVLGSAITGAGLLMLFRHRTGLGGINILAIDLQETFGWRAGWVQLGIDAAILAASVAVLSPQNVALSALGIVLINVILAINHKPGRYLGIS
jgi:uncharacterized membrane-anchored protein YitT (DUF2179 family)